MRLVVIVVDNERLLAIFLLFFAFDSFFVIPYLSYVVPCTLIMILTCLMRIFSNSFWMRKNNIDKKRKMLKALLLSTLILAAGLHESDDPPIAKGCNWLTMCHISIAKDQRHSLLCTEYTTHLT